MDLMVLDGQVFSPDGKVDVPVDAVARLNRDTDARYTEAFRSGQLKSEKIFAYWHERPEGRQIRTWMGTVLATVIRHHEFSCPAFGRPSQRVSFRARGIDGGIWSGVYYKSSGDYVRMRRVKA